MTNIDDADLREALRKDAALLKEKDDYIAELEWKLANARADAEMWRTTFEDLITSAQNVLTAAGVVVIDSFDGLEGDAMAR